MKPSPPTLLSGPASAQPVRAELDLMLPVEVAEALRCYKADGKTPDPKKVYAKPIRKQYDGRRVLYWRADVIAYLAAQQPPRPRRRNQWARPTSA